MKKISAILSFTALLLCGCTVSELNDGRTDSPVFTASFEEMPGTKTYVDSDLYMYWNADDRLSIFTTTYNQQYKFSGKTGDNGGDFEEVAGGFHSGNSISTNYAVYPYSSTTSLSKDEKISLTMPAVQDYAEGSFGLRASTMVAVTAGSSDYFLAFKNLCGFLVVKLYGEGTVKSVSIKGNNGEKLAGPATVTASHGSAPTLAFGDDATETITIDCGAGVVLGSDASHATEFWFCIPPVSFSKGFTITVTDTKGCSMEKSTSTSREVERNIKTSMAALEVSFAQPCEPEYVDLGLSVKWATFNMGAAKPEEYGDYYAWGETEPYYLYGYAQEDPQSHWRTGYGNMGYMIGSKYKWEGSNYSLTKYDYSIDNNLTLDPEDDVAQVMWGSEWRMPTEYEWNELVDNCDFSWIDNYNGTGVKGTLVKSRINNASIFLPAAGVRCGTILSELNEAGHYWSSSSSGQPFAAMNGWFPSGTPSIFEVNGFTHQFGISIRPVYGEYIGASNVSVQDISLEEGDVINLTASILPANCSEKGIVWGSSDESVVTVSGNQLTGISAGTTTLTASWVDDSSINATCTVTVSPHATLPDGPVDLGLSVKWASCNIGATTPEGYGDYYAWGEIETYYEEGYAQEDPQNHWKPGHEDGYNDSFIFEHNVHSTYKWFDDIYYFIKYCTNPQAGIVDKKTVLELVDDVANYKLGGNWRMPTDEEWNELISDCTWQCTMYNGIKGYRVSGNNNSIFLPFAGLRAGDELRQTGLSTYYWSSSLSSDICAKCINIQSADVHTDNFYRPCGLPVRPVCEYD